MHDTKVSVSSTLNTASVELGDVDKFFYHDMDNFLSRCRHMSRYSSEILFKKESIQKEHIPHNIKQNETPQNTVFN